MASWIVRDEQVVRISARVTSFTVVCNACARSIASEGYGAAIVRGSLPLERQRGWLACPRGHPLRVERDLR